MFFDRTAFLILLALAIISVVYVYLTRSANSEGRIKALGGRAQRIPSWLPFGIDLIYYDVRSAMTHTSMQLWQIILDYGKGSHTVEVVVLGQRIVFTDHPENIKAILATQFQDFGKGEPFHKDWYDFLGDSIFTTDLQQWHDARQLLRPHFIKSRLSDLKLSERHVLALMKQLPTDGTTINLANLFLRYSMDVATDFLFGRTTHTLDNPKEKFAQAFAEVQRMQNILVRAGPANGLIPRGSFRKGLAVLDNFIKPYIDEALSLSAREITAKTESETGYTLLHALAASTQDKKVLRDQLVAMLLAGRDTTASTLSWLFYELSQNPSVVEKIRREIQNHVGTNRIPTSDDLRNMKYLQQTISEVLRLYPAVPFNVRLALHDTSLPTGGGPNRDQAVGILKDTAIAYSTLTLQRRPDLYPSDGPPASAFVPERWDHWRPETWQYMPFNGGPRTCMGQDFALTEIKYTVIRMLQKFARVEPRMRPQEQFMKTEIVMQPGAGVMVALRTPEV